MRVLAVRLECSDFAAAREARIDPRRAPLGRGRRVAHNIIADRYGCIPSKLAAAATDHAPVGMAPSPLAPPPFFREIVGVYLEVGELAQAVSQPSADGGGRAVAEALEPEIASHAA